MPVTSGAMLLCATPGPFLIGIDPAKTSRRWAASLPAELRTAPLVLGDRVIGATRSGALASWSATDGHEQWRLAAGALAPPTLISSDGKHGKDLLVRRAYRLRDDDTTYAEGMAVIDAETGSSIEPLGEPRPLAVASGYDDTPQRLPAARQGLLPDLGPAVAGSGYAAAVRGDRLDVVDVQTGRLAWSVELGRRREFVDPATGGSSYAQSDPCLAGDLVIVGSLDGSLAAYELATGHRRWSAAVGPIGSLPDGAGAMCRVQPVVAAGRVYVTTLEGDLVCVDTGDATLEGPHYWGQQR
jgi:outer membrane protein assembly factor BamB